MRIIPLFAFLALMLWAAGSSRAQDAEPAEPLQPGETWASLAPIVLGDATVVDAGGRLVLDAPFRAHDPAMVPLHLTAAAGTSYDQLILVIDENPSPVAAVVSLSDAMQPLDMEFRVRVNAYSNVRALARDPSGTLLMTGRYVRATGGCAAPAARDPSAALAQIGRMKLQLLESTGEGEARQKRVKLMLRHPNYSGLQRDQVTLLNIPANFIDVLQVWQGSDLLFSIEGGISISEDPTVVFRFRDNGAGHLTVRATDLEGGVYEERLSLEGA